MYITADKLEKPYQPSNDIDTHIDLKYYKRFINFLKQWLIREQKISTM